LLLFSKGRRIFPRGAKRSAGLNHGEDYGSQKNEASVKDQGYGLGLGERTADSTRELNQTDDRPEHDKACCHLKAWVARSVSLAANDRKIKGGNFFFRALTPKMDLKLGRIVDLGMFGIQDEVSPLQSITEPVVEGEE
jgi:hypothetical protein